MQVVEINTIINSDNSTRWTANLFECEYQLVPKYDEDDNIVEVSRLVHTSLVDTTELSANEVLTPSECQAQSESHYGI